MTISLSARVAPPHSLILVTTSEAPDVPLLERVLVASTDTCIAVGTLMELDGETEVRMIDYAPHDQSLGLALDCVLRSNEGFLAVRTTDGRELLRQGVTSASQRVRIWVSDSSEPDEIVLELVNE
jgi:hypothetical protein